MWFERKGVLKKEKFQQSKFFCHEITQIFTKREERYNSSDFFVLVSVHSWPTFRAKPVALSHFLLSGLLLY